MFPNWTTWRLACSKDMPKGIPWGGALLLLHIRRTTVTRRRSRKTRWPTLLQHGQIFDQLSSSFKHYERFDATPTPRPPNEHIVGLPVVLRPKNKLQRIVISHLCLVDNSIIWVEIDAACHSVNMKIKKLRMYYKSQ